MTHGIDGKQAFFISPRWADRCKLSREVITDTPGAASHTHTPSQVSRRELFQEFIRVLPW